VPIQLAVRDAGGARGPVGVRLRYRHVNQAETYRVADMEAAGQGRDAAVYQATIPGEYTDSAYPLEYFFELRGGTGTAWLYPGFNAELSNQPYFLLRQASSS
jgi:hypothetical protein